MKKLLLALFYIAATNIFAQNIQPCGTTSPTTPQFENWLQIKIDEIKNHPNSNRSLVTIPIVFHIIHGGEPVGTGPNVSNTKIYSQLDVLTEDFRKMVGTNGYNSNPVGADCEIEFCLGGIERINYVSKGWNISPPAALDYTYIETVVKPQSIWDPNSYLNVWVLPVYPIAFRTGGYATYPTASGLQFPGSAYGTQQTDGVVMYYVPFGRVGEVFPIGTSTNGVLDGTPILGRVLTHEVGHFLGLIHTFEGGCTIFGTGGDYCSDIPSCEPLQGHNPCSHINCSANNRMCENYMDYSVESCYNIFTGDQKARISAVLANSPRRTSLTFGASCCDENFAIINPNSNFGGQVLPCSGSCAGSLIAYGTGGVQPYQYKWSTGGTTQVISNLCAGVYTLTMTDSKGCPATATYTINNPSGGNHPTANAGSDVTIQAGASTTLQGSGGGSYSWSPTSSLSNSHIYNPVAAPSSTTTYILTVTDVNGCTDTDPVVVTVIGGGGSAPANDNPCSATLLTVGTGCSFVTGTNLNATNTTNPGTPSLCSGSSTSGSSSGGYSGGDVWFKAVVPSSGKVVINTQIQSSIYDLVLTVYTGSCSSLSQIACNDDRVLGSNYMPYLSLTSLTPGQTIYIRVWEFGNNVTGNFGICVQDPGGTSSSNDPDLAISISSISTTNPSAGGSVTLNMTVTNSGTVSINTPFTARIVLSNDATLNYSNDIQLSGSTQTISSLANGASTTFAKTITIPVNTANGNYYLIAEVDVLNDQIDELSENNNTAYRSITIGTIAANEVDLDNYNENATPSTGLAPGMQINVACNVRNLGTTTALGARVGYFFSNDANYNPGTDIYLTDDALGTLVTNGTTAENANVYIPNVSSTGTKYILFVADYQNVTSDINLSNNVSFYPITISSTTPARPDYTCNLLNITRNSLAVSTNNLIPYDTLKFWYTGTNIGNLNGFTSSKIKVVISDDVIMDDNDFFIGIATNSTGIDIAEVDSNTSTRVIDGIGIGPKFLITQIDIDNTVIESNENNNKFIVPITIVPDTFHLPDIDINITSVTPYTSNLGDTVLVTGYVTNIGIGAVPSNFSVGFYLSYDNIYQGTNAEPADLGALIVPSGLNVGDTFYFTKPVYSKHASQTGLYYVISVADDNQAIAELTKQNNVSSVPIFIQSIACYYNLKLQIDTVNYKAGTNTSNQVYTEDTCSWLSSSNSTWLNGNSTLQTGGTHLYYTYQKNKSPYPRIDSIIVMGHRFLVYQKACPITPAHLGQDILTCNSTVVNANPDATQTSFTWSTGATTSSIPIPSSGLYSVTISNDSGCITSDTIQVTLSSNSTAPSGITANQNPICVGSSVLLTRTGGTLGQMGEWKWYSGSCGGTLVGTGDQILVSPNGNAQYFVRAEGCNTTTCVPITVNVVSVPTIDAGQNINVIEGSTATLSASGGASYLWSNGDTTQSISISPLVTGYYYVLGHDNNGCEAIDSVLVTVVPDCSSVVANAGTDVLVCAGDSATLTASGGISYVWNTGATNNSITVSPSTYTVTVTTSNGCTAADQVIVASAAPPATPTITGTTTSCDSVILLANSLNCIGCSYYWSSGDTTNVALFNTSGFYTVSATNNCGSATTNGGVTVFLTPTATISYSNAGSIYTFNSNPQNSPTTYNWDFGDGNSDNSANPSHTYSITGSITVSLTVTNICGSNTYQQSININPNCSYSLSQNTVVADSNGTSQAIAVTSGGTCTWNVTMGNCSWLSVAPSNGTGTNSFTVTIPATTDTFVKQCTLTVEGQTISVTQYGKVGSIPCVPVDTSVQVNGGCDLAAATIIGASYQWYRSGIQIPNATSQYYTATQNGYYKVQIAVGNCTYESSDHYLSCFSDIKESLILNLRVYPNPTDGTFIISGEAKNATQLSVNLYNTLGQIVYDKNIFLMGTIIREEIRVASLSTGIYHLQLLIDKHPYNQKLVVK